MTFAAFAFTAITIELAVFTVAAIAVSATTENLILCLRHFSLDRMTCCIYKKNLLLGTLVPTHSNTPEMAQSSLESVIQQAMLSI